MTWWGIFGPLNNTPVTPVSFDLIFYADSGGLPDPTNVISSTTVSFASLTDTGVNLNGKDIYVFRANLTPTALPGGTKVWFSVLANTSNDPDDNFLWRDDLGGSSAYRSPLSAAFTAYANATSAFILDDAPVPVPPVSITSFAPIGGGVFALTLKGAKGTAYEFRSSTTLEFAPGTLVSNLTKGNWGDPGTISGTNNSVVTTDGSSNATVRLTLTGPANFVRAQTTR